MLLIDKTSSPLPQPRRRALLLIGLGLMTIINIGTYIGAMTAMMSPMMFDRGGENSKLMWAFFAATLAVPIVALVSVFLPWVLFWFWPRVALVSSAIPVTIWLIFLIAIASIF
jgi:hypothetical protein